MSEDWRTPLRNTLVWVAVLLFYAVTFRALGPAMDLLQIRGGSRFVLFLVWHVVYGTLGYFSFTGPFWLRNALVFAALLAYGIAMEVLIPVRGYPYTHVSAMLLFGLFAAAGVASGRFLGTTMARLKQGVRQ